MDDISFEAIRPNVDNARAIQQIKLDLLPHSAHYRFFVNPDGTVQVNRQIDELKRHRERFTGAFSKGELLGFMKVGDWELRNEMAFASEEELPELERLIEAGKTYPSQYKLGIFGLAVSREVDSDRAEAIASNFLYQATDLALNLEHTAINIELFENDPLRSTIMNQGYAFTGRLNGPLMHTRSIVKRLYSKSLDI